ncbi:TetR/AcrR family transcriptional regulator (plasmid) [Bacillus cereus]|uniref:TetR/AcrR family transcriptional regulator n=1 Tax=Bacillus cereus TaxID=1396 RepID=UPI0015609514|nr:TetR/AcrR family transcriptional regulator [Bacillus cereus]QKH04687.1 TetR/AcrR family transcriptional regulator [Bacillus cereus]QKH10740.1 TetR/AcrR family transcriptional regulator [Bacillus cereus]
MSKRDTRKRLLDAARDIFSEKGYDASTVRAISDRAGVREITLFRHFESKERLFSEVITENLKKLSPEQILPEYYCAKLSGDLRETLHLLAKNYLSFCRENIPIMRIGMREASQNDEFASFISEIPRKLEEHLVSYLNLLYKDGKIQITDTVRMAKMFYGILFSHIYENYLFNSGKEGNVEEDEEVIIACVNLFVTGISAGK